MIAVRAAADPAHPEGGHAIILLQGVMDAPADPRFRILREGWGKGTLGTDGWQVSDAMLSPDRVEPSPQGVRLYLGPQVVDWLEAGPVQFRLPGAAIDAPLFWPDVPPLHGGSGHTMAMPAPAPAVRPAPPPPPLPTADPDATMVMAPPRVDPPALSVPQPATPVQTGSALPWLLLALLLLLAAAAGGAYWWFAWREQPAPPAPPQIDPIEIAPEPLPRDPPQVVTPPDLPPVRQQADPGAPATLEGLSVAEVISRAASPAAIAAEAARRFDAGRYDDALLLWEAAAAAGESSSLARLARLYDPVGFEPGRPFRDPDPRQAARQYRDAVRAGAADAAEPRARLRQWLDDRAREGDFNAPLTIRDFWP